MSAGAAPDGAADREVRTRDGRVVLARDHGPPGGVPLVFHHGSPGCRLMGADEVAAAHARGFRLVSYDRPGYAGSSPHPGRRVADAAGDTAAVADALGLGAFAVWGVSGGGPHALACAALLADRVTAAAVVAGVGPHGEPGLDFVAGMGESSQIEFRLARDDRAGLEAYVRTAAAEVRGSREGVIAAWGSLLAPCDRAAVVGPFGGRLLDDLEVALEPGLAGWLDDDIAFVEPWDVPLDRIAAPVAVIHGREDLMVPHAHGEWLARAIPGARLESLPAEGHLTLAADPTRPLDWLASTARGGRRG